MSMVGRRLDLNREHRMVPNPDDGNSDWAIQDGIIFGWSESNLGYERAWWLNEDGTPRTPQTPLMTALCRTRPFDPKWLTNEAA